MIHRLLTGAKSGITRKNVPVGDGMIRVPVATFGDGQGKTLLVTAGMDGDEYASIDAAYALIEKYRQSSCRGTLVVIPILNVPGFESETSYNPMDRKYPKYISRGKQAGSPSERLIWWLHTAYAFDADVWVDMHGGSLTEDLTPFFWGFETRTATDRTTKEILQSVVSPIRVYERRNRYTPMHTSEHHTSYFIAECGTGGRRDRQARDMHVSWVEQCMNALDMISVKKTVTTGPVYTGVRIQHFPSSGYWVPCVSAGQQVSKGDVVGRWSSLDTTRQKDIRSISDGYILWCKSGASAHKGETAVALGTDQGRI